VAASVGAVVSWRADEVSDIDTEGYI